MCKLCLYHEHSLKAFFLLKKSPGKYLFRSKRKSEMLFVSFFVFSNEQTLSSKFKGAPLLKGAP